MGFGMIRQCEHLLRLNISDGVQAFVLPTTFLRYHAIERQHIPI